MCHHNTLKRISDRDPMFRETEAYKEGRKLYHCTECNEWLTADLRIYDNRVEVVEH